MVTEAWLAAALGMAALGQLGFVLAYVSNGWWTTRVGQILFTTGLALFLSLAAGATGLAWDWPYEMEIRFGFNCALALVLWGQTAMSCHVRAEAHREGRCFQKQQEVAADR